MTSDKCLVLNDKCFMLDYICFILNDLLLVLNEKLLMQTSSFQVPVDICLVTNVCPISYGGCGLLPNV